MTKGVLFHQDSAAEHKSVVAIAAVSGRGFELVDYSPYSPDLAPSDYSTLYWEAVIGPMMRSF